VLSCLLHTTIYYHSSVGHSPPLDSGYIPGPTPDKSSLAHFPLTFATLQWSRKYPGVLVTGEKVHGKLFYFGGISQKMQVQKRNVELPTICSTQCWIKFLWVTKLDGVMGPFFLFYCSLFSIYIFPKSLFSLLLFLEAHLGNPKFMTSHLPCSSVDQGSLSPPANLWRYLRIIFPKRKLTWWSPHL